MTMVAAFTTAIVAHPVQAQQDMDEVKFGLLPGLPLYLSLWVADDQGFFAEENVKPTYISVGGGGAQTMAALLGDSYDTTDLSLQAVANANMQGQDLRIIAGNHTDLTYALVVSSELAEPVHEDGYPTIMHKLRGKKVAASTIGSNSYMVMKRMLEGADMTFDDIQLVQVQTGSSVIAMMASGQLDASLQSEPNISILTDQLEKARVVLDLRDAADLESMGLSGMIYDVWIAKASVAKEDRVIRATRAIDKAIAYMQDPDTDIAYLMKLVRENLGQLEEMPDDLLKKQVESLAGGFGTVVTREDVRKTFAVMGIDEQPYDSVVTGLAAEK